MAPIPAGVLPADESTARDAAWFTNIYQGDRMPQLSARAVLTGAVIGAFLSIANLYMTMKVGLGAGVALTACLLSYFSWRALQAVTGGRVVPLSILEANCMQSTASAAGFSTGGTLAVAFAALMMLDPEHRQQPWWVVAAYTFTTAAMGIFLAVPMKRLLINEEQLPYPSGTAAAATLRNLYADGRDALNKALAMFTGLVVGVLVGILTTAEGQFGALGRFFAWMRAHLFEVHLPNLVPAQGFALVGGKPAVGFGFEPGVAVIGIGMLVGLRVALSMLLAALALFLFIAPWLQSYDAAHAGLAGYVPSMPAGGGGAFYNPLRWAIWTGSSVLFFASLTSLALNGSSLLRSLASLRQLGNARTVRSGGSAEREAIEVPASWMVAGLVPIACALIALQVVAFGVAWWAGVIAVAMSFVLAFVAARATGETDINPLGSLGKVMQLLFAVIAPPGAVGLQASLNHNVVSAGIAASTASASADLLIDLKSGYLLGGNPRKQFLAQFAGIFVGTLVCVPAWFLLVPNFAALEKYPVPAAQSWVAAARVLTGGVGNLPTTIVYGILAGALVGIVLPLLEKLLPRARAYLPSTMGLGLAWVVPFTATLSIAIGAILAALWTAGGRNSAQLYRVPLASGLIAGDAMVHAVLAMLATALGLAG
jgi:putative OPT family oligopeptide transporter